MGPWATQFVELGQKPSQFSLIVPISSNQQPTYIK
jgi:hypothetical protein